ncbi:hypothetical protein IB265_32905 [Ensifer sp. ENS10]|uniref:hypothetical protein n=1 Tax=Ensifer sp. ENS10 TaxID=2769286 RepID=UPI00177A8A4F|nr:hypothetical protein [Ensifer sp. ENS10]MBD9511557.1 hypothetical protein [Ensifer sp. ENS10]
MTDKFPQFAKAVKEKFDILSDKELYVVDVERDEMFDLYLASFPEGTNPIFRVRTEHDGSYDRAFIRNVGHVVSLEGGRIQTIWSFPANALPYPYDVVAKALDERVKSRAVKSLFRTVERSIGHAPNHEIIDGVTHRFTHFQASIADRHRSSTPDADRGKATTNLGVFRRGLETLSIGNIEQVLELIEGNALYRGAEHKRAVEAFKKLSMEYPRRAPEADKAVFLWLNYNNPAALFRNTVIGTLVDDLSAGVELEAAVRSFEKKVAPENYKRTTSLITPKMIEQAVDKLKELGLESAVERRFAKLSDVSVNNVLFVDNSVAPQMKDGLTGLLMTSAKSTPVDIKKAMPITVDEFFENVVPNARGIKVLVQNKHMANFMSLTAPVDPDAGKLFKWDNQFAWSYDGDVTDSLKERVKAAGGNVKADFRISLGWFNYDDLDIHVHWPGGAEIFYGDKQGHQDVDMNVSPSSRKAVENVVFNGRDVYDGVYRVGVHNFTKRENIDVGFELEVECMGAIHRFTYDRAVGSKNMVKALEITVKDRAIVAIKPGDGVQGGSFSQGKWGVTTEQLVPVNTLMASPNHWDGQEIGNKHWFFILKDCINPDQVRGFYNEYLKGEFEPHRKVFEVLGAKTKCAPSTEQLSGVGFSSTRKDKATVVVEGDKATRAYEISF